MKITKQTNITTIIDKYPKLTNVLINKYNFHCVGCFAAAFETLEQGAKAHGMNKKQIEEMVIELSRLAKKKNKK